VRLDVQKSEARDVHQLQRQRRLESVLWPSHQSSWAKGQRGGGTDSWPGHAAPTRLNTPHRCLVIWVCNTSIGVLRCGGQLAVPNPPAEWPWGSPCAARPAGPRPRRTRRGARGSSAAAS
jgi:hypothetical protein